ncbi:hypothetical protein ACFVT2_22970 [Streptomyces sp. NPDC058000]|uniref:hypothetical protein n=1 Tax=Streptomyces sp. NPDC058000 TaxID=3346299 RepID=UPI0036E5FC9B
MPVQCSRFTGIMGVGSLCDRWESGVAAWKTSCTVPAPPGRNAARVFDLASRHFS